ncbi:MAG: hypothetical protein JSV33_07415 [bacterium]|nr:MAG: hypothetical protein JSV33_07415 [bacterium]
MSRILRRSLFMHYTFSRRIGVSGRSSRPPPLQKRLPVEIAGALGGHALCHFELLIPGEIERLREHSEQCRVDETGIAELRGS